jgi:anti-sigma B factor antagonist
LSPCGTDGGAVLALSFSAFRKVEEIIVKKPNRKSPISRGQQLQPRWSIHCTSIHDLDHKQSAFEAKKAEKTGNPDNCQNMTYGCISGGLTLRKPAITLAGLLPARFIVLETEAAGRRFMAQREDCPMVSSAQVCWKLTTEETADGTRVSIPGSSISLDEISTGPIGEELFRLVDERGRCRLLLDFSNVTYLTSGTLGMLLNLHKRLHLLGGRLYINHVLPHIHEIFTLTRLTRLLNVSSQ